MLEANINSEVAIWKQIKFEDEKRDSNTKRIKKRVRPLKHQIRRWTEQTGKLLHESKKLPPSLSESNNEAAIRLKQTSYLLHGRAVRVESLLGLEDEQKGNEQPDASATATLRHLPEAGSSAAERWPQRKRLTWQPHCALSSPGSSMCRTPPLHCSRGWKHHDQIQPLLANPFSLKKPVHNNWELEGDEIIIFL